MKAIILAGGLGTRLQSVVADRSKVLASVNGRPFLYWLLRCLVRDGFDAVCLAIGYRGEQIVETFGDHFATPAGRLEIRYSEESTPLGTGGALAQALERFPGSGPVFVLNGDTYLDLNWRDMLARHAAHAALLSIALRYVEERGRFGSVSVQGERIVRFGEKDSKGPGLINAGVYLVERGLFERIPRPLGAYSFEADIVAAHLALIDPVAFPTDGAFLDIGIPEDYQRAGAFLSGLGMPDYGGTPDEAATGS